MAKNKTQSQEQNNNKVRRTWYMAYKAILVNSRFIPPQIISKEGWRVRYFDIPMNHPLFDQMTDPNFFPLMFFQDGIAKGIEKETGMKVDKEDICISFFKEINGLSIDASFFAENN